MSYLAPVYVPVRCEWYWCSQFFIGSMNSYSIQFFEKKHTHSTTHSDTYSWNEKNDEVPSDMLGVVEAFCALCANEFGACSEHLKRRRKTGGRKKVGYSITIIAIAITITIALYLSHLMVCSLLNNVRQRLNYQLSIHCFLPPFKHTRSPQMCNKFFLSLNFCCW